MKKDRTEIERRRALVGKSKIGSHCRAGEGDRPQAWFLHVDRTLSPVSGSERNRGEILLCREGTRARASFKIQVDSRIVLSVLSLAPQSLR